MRIQKVVISILLLVVFLVILMSNKIFTNAEEKPCSLTVKVDESIQEDFQKTDTVYDLYKIADLTQTENNDYQLVVNNENYTNLKSYIENMESFSDNRYEKLRQELTKTIFYTGKDIAPDFSSNPFDKKLSDLGEGLYLMIIHGENLLPEDYIRKEKDKEEYTTVTYSDYYQYSFSPSLIILKKKKKVSKEEINIGEDPKTLNYDVTLIPKAEINTRKGNITIIKEIDSCLEGHPETFIFEVTATYQNQVIYNDVIGMTFSHAGKKETRIEKEIPVGASVNVKEIYSGSHYVNHSEKEQTMTVLPEADQNMLKFHFSNHYISTFKFNGTIINSYECQKDIDGKNHWDVQQFYEGEK